MKQNTTKEQNVDLREQINEIIGSLNAAAWYKATNATELKYTQLETKELQGYTNQLLQLITDREKKLLNDLQSQLEGMELLTDDGLVVKADLNEFIDEKLASVQGQEKEPQPDAICPAHDCHASECVRVGLHPEEKK